MFWFLFHQGGPKKKDDGKSKNFASEADFVKQSLLLWVQNKTTENSYANVKVSFSMDRSPWQNFIPHLVQLVVANFIET